jgi:hypothetical protein
MNKNFFKKVKFYFKKNQNKILDLLRITNYSNLDIFYTENFKILSHQKYAIFLGYL